ncbi:PREDICTED: uncharacterized protein LOC109215390 [Nicotiana attenuata]|uniref:Isopenicillin N synthase-like Fe(2+) 2OG dioxygenase domain-containing protein n=1 Tax=Nicotiana attenuata TaxID=49451 RepID=A0A1J6K8B6_NICAT|nr:PREDICTED: uncharacterized protein LOC109215390 [Nicotiana attenuata]XP_019234998.1 PREDICTED: uncharacterized protein LOC109215390 [Nicotiana attenuata]XP_019234999.1 PREDICTED: uncharacterized protein LOC109215390 [Nicotiana attenuata]OIT26370.1 hypothetical protein A4A49_36717 [Nicotiana attenuata]
MEGEVVELYELHYSDLKKLSSERALSAAESCEEIQRLESITTSVMENLGPEGPGLLAITGVPEASNLRRTLLPLARKLSLLNNEDRKRLLKEHSLGSDVSLKNPNRNVSSFSMQLKYEQCFERSDGRVDDLDVENRDDEVVNHYEFKKLGCTFKELGYCMMDLGLRLAQICDKDIGGQELQQSLLESGTAKGRLIHYHSAVDNDIIREAAKRNGYVKSRNGKVNKNEQASTKQQGTDLSKDQSNDYGLWQQWHYDYGIFTLLTVPMFLLSSHQETPAAVNTGSPVSSEHEFPSPCGHTYLQIFDPKKNQVFMVKAPLESLILQVGEAADILSKGKLRATLHCVCRPPKIENLSRETFVVFLQPAWSKQFSLLDYPLENLNFNGQQWGIRIEGIEQPRQAPEERSHEIQKIVPPLLSRLKDGMTFADFSRETTKQYYGGKGLQPNR